MVIHSIYMTIKPLILFLIILFLSSTHFLIAQQEQDLSVLHIARYSNRIGQTYCIDSVFPYQFVESNKTKGYHIAQISAGNKGICVLMNYGTLPQDLLLSDTLPVKDIEENWSSGFRVSSLAYANNKWYCVMSLDNGIIDQKMIITKQFPRNLIDSLWNIGLRLSQIAYGNGTWIIIMNRQMITSGQSYSISDTVPSTRNSQNQSNGIWPASVFDIGNSFITIKNGYTQSFDHRIMKPDGNIRDTIQYLWEQGYTIINMCMARSSSEFLVSRQNFRDSVYESIDLVSIPKNNLEIQQLDRFINRTAPSYGAMLAIQKIAAHFIVNNEWQKAAEVYRSYIPLMKGFESTIKKSIGLLTDKEDSIQVINLGKTINTIGAEWDPIPTPDGKYLFMSVRDRIGGEGRQDVFYAEQKKDTLSIEQWDTPLSVGPGVNTRNGEETVDNVSADGNTLLLSGTFPGSYGRFDIYTAERTENGWDNLRQLPKPINSEHHDESGCLTSDGKALLFSSDRPGAIGNVFAPMNSRYHGGGNGNMDIYICIKSDTGWTNPINLGTTINTPFSERSLFLHPDGKTLYFSSDGHYGIGGLDVFKSTRLSDTSWTQWSEPVNLGRNINTVQDDFSYKITVGGDTAYFAAQNRIDGIGDWDIYKVVLPKHIRPQPVITIKGFVIDKSGKPVKAMIVWEDLKDGKSIGSAQSNPIDGSYIVVLPLGKNYGYYAKADGYFPVSANIDARKELKGNSKQKNIIMYPIGDTNSQEITLQLTNVFFDYGKDNLQSSSFPELNRLSEILLKHRFHFIKISGHTDDIGSDTYNLTLSLNRAKRVKQYLVKKGIQSNFIEIIGYGKSMPKVIGVTEEARIENRRVEISIK